MFPEAYRGADTPFIPCDPNLIDQPTPPWQITQQPFIREGLLADVESGWQAYGDTFETSFGGLRTVVVSHPDEIQKAFTDPNYRNKGPMYDGLRAVVGDGVLTSAGEDWKRSRKVVTPPFHRKQVAEMTGAIVVTGSRFIDRLRAEHPDGGVIDLQKEMTTLTLDTLFATLFGDKSGSGSELAYDTLTSAFELAGKLASGQDLDEAGQQKYHMIVGKLDSVAEELIQGAYRRDPDGTLLSMLTHSYDLSAEERLDNRKIRDELLTILFAGHETTALTLTWLYKMLENREDVAANMQAEVAAVLGGRAPEPGDIPALTYMRQVTDEVLRLRPIVPLVARVALQSDELGGIELDAGDVVMPYIAGTHRHPEFWENPEAFDPDRFSAENNAKRHKLAYLPFATGNRICLGKALALTELVVHTTLLAQNFAIKTIPDSNGAHVQMTLRPTEPVMATIEPLRS